MRLLFDISLLGPDDNEALRRDFEQDVVIPPGVMIEDAAWAKPRAPTDIVAAPGYFHYQFQVEKFKTDAEFKAAVSMYHSHGWRRP